MKLVDSLNSSLSKRKSSSNSIDKKRINSLRHKEQAGEKNKVLIFWALVVFSAGLIFVSWLFFLKLELKDVARGGTFGKIFSSLGQAVTNAQEDLAELKNINFEKIQSENETKNQNKKEVSPEIKDLEEQVFPQFKEQLD